VTIEMSQVLDSDNKFHLSRGHSACCITMHIEVMWSCNTDAETLDSDTDHWWSVSDSKV